MLLAFEWATGECQHEAMSAEHPEGKQWLEAGSAPHAALRKVVFDMRLVRNIPYFVNFR